VEITKRTFHNFAGTAITLKEWKQKIELKLLLIEKSSSLSDYLEKQFYIIKLIKGNGVISNQKE